MSKFKRKSVIDRSTADKQVEMFLEYYDIDPEFMLPKVAEALENQRLSMVKAVMRGRLSVEESGEGIKVTQILVSPVAGKDRITYQELNATASKAARRVKGVEEQIWALLAALGKITEEAFDDMDPVDRSVASDIGNCFLTV